MARSSGSPKTTAWSGKVLIPLWTLQLLTVMATIGAYIASAVLLSNTFYWDNTGVVESYPFVEISSIVLVLLHTTVLGVLIFQIVKYRKDALVARTMLAQQIVLMAYWSVCFVIALLGVGGRARGYVTLTDFCLTICAWFLFLGTLIYSGVIFHRRQKAVRQRWPTKVESPEVEVEVSQPVRPHPHDIETLPGYGQNEVTRNDDETLPGYYHNAADSNNVVYGRDHRISSETLDERHPTDDKV